MRGKFRKYLPILGIAVITGFFIQFSFGKKDFREVVLPSVKQMPPFFTDTAVWADSVFDRLNTQQKVAQLIMVAAYPKKGDADKERVTALIKKYGIGGIIFFQATPDDVAKLAAYYQSISKVPLLIAIDGEWGLAMRLSNTIQYPKQMMLGAVSDEMLIYQMGRDIACQMKQLGIHINFAPVADINNNADNPVINSRSFGEQKINVARKSLLYMKGMQDEGILAFAKHFPGHGDTKTDSHYGLPVIEHSRERLDSLELYPFRALINAGVGGVMIAHMNVISLDPTLNLPSTLSPLIVNTLLQKDMGFKGLVVTDAMEMKGVADMFTPVVANIKAIEAGNDIILMPGEIEKTIEAVVKAIDDEKLDLRQIERSCRKILKAKQWVLHETTKTTYSYEKIHKPTYYLNRHKLVESAVTLVQNKKQLVPLRSLDTLKIAHLGFGTGGSANFSQNLKLYAKVDYFNFELSDKLSPAKKKEIFTKLRNYNLVVLSVHSNSLKASENFMFNKSDQLLVDSLIQQYPVALAGFINPYAFRNLKNLDKSMVFLEAYESDSVSHKVAAEILFGALPAQGKLPVSISSQYPAGTGIETNTLDRFSYVLPVDAGFDEKKLARIDSIVNDAINQKAFPGCQVFAARKGKVFFYKSYGYHTYSNKQPVELTDLYDLASVTKISSTVPALMRLQKEKMFDPGDKLVKYFPYLDTSAKGNLLCSDILLHQAGLKAWIPFYWSTLEPAFPGQDLVSTKQSETYPVQLGPRVFLNKHLIYKKDYFSKVYTDEYPFQVADGLFLRKDFSDSIWNRILSSELETPGKYKYSDLGFYIFSKLIEQVTGCNLDEYVDSVFYNSLGAYTLGFNPLKRFKRDEIVPTENDLAFRKQLVHGYVHDPGAAMIGGVSGHAGLFGNANDLAKMMQLYLNNGRYGGREYLDKKIIAEYTSCIACNNGNRRGYGFDKPQPGGGSSGPGFTGLSTASFGHTGFTGTMTWADPDTDIIYVFLSNRVYPDAMNNLLVQLDVRTKVHKAIYDAMLVAN